MSRRKWAFRLQDMLHAAHKIGDYVEGLTFEGFLADEKTYDAGIRQLTILGEAASHVPDGCLFDDHSTPQWGDFRLLNTVET